MSNTINWSEIYNTTYWGDGVSTNSISWGNIYEEEVNQNEIKDV